MLLKLSLLALPVALLAGYFLVYPRTYTDVQPAEWAVGSITSTSVSFWVRKTPEGAGCGSTELPVWVSYRPLLNTSDDDMVDSERKVVDSARHFTATLQVADLVPDTDYVFRCWFMYPRWKGMYLEVRLRTLAAHGDRSPLSFVFGSCFSRFAWPLNDIALTAINSTAMLNPVPRFALFLGDIIYSDFPNRISFTRAYENLMSWASFRWINWRIPAFFQMDDHEVENDWSGIDHPRFAEATALYDQFLGDRNPKTFVGDDDDDDVRYYTIRHGRVAFFVLDTRSHRGADTMLGARQLSRLTEWLSSTSDTNTTSIRFIASPAAWADFGGADGWRTRMLERNAILDSIETTTGPKTVLLSGDLHYSLVTEIRPHIYEYSVSPIMSFPLVPLQLAAGDNDHRTVFKSSMRNHIGRIDIDENGGGTFKLYGSFLGTSTVSELYSQSL